MTTTGWIIDIALILIVFRQLREERLTARTILLPVALMSWAGFTYLHSVPTAGDDLVLIGLLTRVRYGSGNVYIKATVSAAALWVVSMGCRMGFAVWSSYGSGISHITSFSAAHDITGGQAGGSAP